MLESKLVTIYLKSSIHSGVDEHLSNYLQEGWEISEIYPQTHRTGINSLCGWLIVKLTRAKGNRWAKPA